MNEVRQFEYGSEYWKARLIVPTISPGLFVAFQGIQFTAEGNVRRVVRVRLSDDDLDQFVPLKSVGPERLQVLLGQNMLPEPTSCPICSGFVSARGRSTDESSYSCERCGEFTITSSAKAVIGAGGVDRGKLSIAVRHRFDTGMLSRITSDELTALVESAPSWRTLSEGVDRLLVSLALEAPGYLEPIDVDEDDYTARLYVRTRDSVRELLRVAKALELITDTSWPRVTMEGWERIETVLAARPKAARVFVAMAFDDETNLAYTKGIEPGVLETNYYRPFRVDRDHHTNRIDDHIIASIRQSAIVLADFTLHRGGVYFEAGFALGLRIPVIWSCRKDHMKDLHFDVRQYNMLSWETPDELRSLVRDRLLAMYPPPGTQAL